MMLPKYLQLFFPSSNGFKHNDDYCGTKENIFVQFLKLQLVVRKITFVILMHECNKKLTLHPVQLFVTFWRQFFINQTWWSLNLSQYLMLEVNYQITERASIFYELACFRKLHLVWNNHKLMTFGSSSRLINNS